MTNPELIQTINTDLALALPEKISFDKMQHELSDYINQLIKIDFEKLVAILYRIDVNEEKLKTFLIYNPNEDAGKVIADLVVERLQQKINLRKQFSGKSLTDDDEEKW
ncbi:hypothetical protein [Ferruginibacter sp.]|nr:hypothetical protein [Ferruginibacter sp.]